MAWKCEQCGEINYDESIIKCPCGNERSENSPARLEEEPPEELLKAYQSGNAASKGLSVLKKTLVSHGLLSSSNWNVTFGWSRTQSDKFGFKGKGTVSVDNSYIEVSGTRSRSLLVKVVCYIVSVVILSLVGGYLMDFAFGSREMFWHGFAGILSIAIPLLFVGTICRYHDTVFLRRLNVSDVSRNNNRISFNGVDMERRTRSCLVSLETEDAAKNLEQSLSKKE